MRVPYETVNLIVMGFFYIKLSVIYKRQAMLKLIDISLFVWHGSFSQKHVIKMFNESRIKNITFFVMKVQQR